VSPIFIFSCRSDTNTPNRGSVIGSQIYRKWDAPYYKIGNKVCISILSLAVIAVLCQRQYLIHLNKKKEAEWDQMTPEQKVAYQMDKKARERDGNKRLDFRFAY
jgi:hypothetical protein